jgi:hypothetical protein
MVRAGGPAGPVGKERNPVMVLALSYVTCMIYGVVQLWGMVNELKAYRQKDDINPVLFIIPIVHFMEIWKLPEKVLEAKRMAGVPNPTVPAPILYLLLWTYFLPADLNEVWTAAGGGRPSQG